MNAQVPANGARGGHPRTVPHPKMSSKGRTELQISLSGAKNAEESAGDVRFCVAPQKTGENIEKLRKHFNFFSIFFSKKVPKCRICATSNEDLIINFHFKTFIQDAKLIYWIRRFHF